MDLMQLKLLAGRIRVFLEQSNHSLGHNQALDLIAALPGLRSWPEVQAFPDRVAACELDLAAAGRLAYRLRKKFGMELSQQTVLAAVTVPGAEKQSRAPQIWPAGPRTGVYVTTSQKAIDALLARYEEDTDGAIVYAERAGNGGENAIDLGESGLWSNGMSRVPSGTLIVVGPLKLNQQSWNDSASHLEIACLNALNYEHRVAILLETPTPNAICEDVLLLVKQSMRPGDDCDTALLGVVTDDGQMQIRMPFANKRPPLASIKSVANADAIPPAVRALLQQALVERRSGLLIFGNDLIEEHPGIEMAAAALALTSHAGPAARIMPRDRSTPAKDWLVPEAIKQLPFLPSIESAYDQGYRRMIYSPNYLDGDALLKYAKDVLFIGGTYHSDVDEIFMSAMRGTRNRQESDLLANVIALLGVKQIPTKLGTANACDLIIMHHDMLPAEPLKMKLDDALTFLKENRVLKWEDQVTAQLNSGEITASKLKEVFSRNHNVTEFLAQRAAGKKKAMSVH